MVCNFLSLSYYILLWKVLMKRSVGYCTIFSDYVIFLIYNITYAHVCDNLCSSCPACSVNSEKVAKQDFIA